LSKTTFSSFSITFREEKYSEDFEDEADESAKKSSPKKAPQDKQSPTKKGSPPKQTQTQKKLDFPETGLKLPKNKNETDKPEDIGRRPSNESGASKDLSPQKTKQTLDSATLERIDLEECYIELKGILKKKRVLFLQFCEEKVKREIKNIR